MVGKGDPLRELIPKAIAGKGKTTMKTLIFSIMKTTLKHVPKCLSMKLKF
jgi:hypothetical protein